MPVRKRRTLSNVRFICNRNKEEKRLMKKYVINYLYLIYKTKKSKLKLYIMPENR
jgi:hypothetical protein